MKDEDFFHFIGKTAIAAVTGFCMGKKPKIKIGLEWEDGVEKKASGIYNKRERSDVRTGAPSTKSRIWFEADDQ